MAIRRLSLIVIFILLGSTLSFLGKAETKDKREFYGKQFVNAEIGEVLNVVIADNISDSIEKTYAERLIGVNPADFYQVQDGEINLLVTLRLSERVKAGVHPTIVLFAKSGEQLWVAASGIDKVLTADRTSWNFRIPTNAFKEGETNYIQVHVPVDNISELLLSWPVHLTARKKN